MALSRQGNPLLNAPALRGLIEIGLENASFPLVLPATLETEFRRYASEDIPLEPPLNGTYERRLLDEPEITLALSNDRAGIQESEEIAFSLSNADGDLNALMFTRPVLTTLVRYHLYDRETKELQPNLFVGLLSALEAELDVIHCRASRLNVATLTRLVPLSRVTEGNSPRSVKEPPSPTGGRDSVIPTGTGVGKRIPARKVSGPRSTSEDTGDPPLGLTDPDFHDYDCGKGNLTIDRVWASGALVDKDDSLPDSVIYELVPRFYTGASGGKYRTVLRFRQYLAETIAQLPVTVDVQRVCPDIDDAVLLEHKWNATFADTISGLLAIGQGGLSPAACVVGPSGVGLGALAMNGTSNYIDFLFGQYARCQTFSVECWVNVMPKPSGMILMTSPGVDRTGVEESGWYLEWGGDTRLTWGVFMRDVASPATLHEWRIITNAGVVSPMVWHHILATCDAKLGRTQLFVDGVEQEAGTGDWGAPFTVIYRDAAVAMAAGRPLLDAVPMWFDGKLGFVRYSAGVARTARYAARAWWMMRRNPIEFLREFLIDELGEAVDPALWDEATRDLDSALTTNGGELKADGYLTEETTAQAVLESFLPFRDLRFWREPNGLVGIGVTKPATTVTASFGIGDAFNNIVEFSRRIWPSLVEAIQTQPIKYRWQRDENGAPRSGSDEFGFEIAANVLPVGGRAEPLLLPWVFDHVTAEAIRQWQEKRQRSRAELLEIVVGHEGRFVVPDPDRLVHIQVDTHEIDADYEVVRVTPRVTTRALALTPYDPGVFVWTVPDPTTLPKDPVIDTALTMNVGTNPHIRARQVVPGRYTFDIVLGDQIILPVLRPGTYQEFTYGNGRATYWLDPTGLRQDLLIRDLHLDVQARQPSLDDILSIAPVMTGTPGYPFGRWASVVTLANEPSFITKSMEGTQNPFTHRAWEVRDFFTYQFGISVFGRIPPPAEVKDLVFSVAIGQDYPPGFSHAKLWVLGPYGTSDPEPDPPSLDVVPTSMLRDLADLNDGIEDPEVREPGRYYPFARLYDNLGRPSVVIGPTPFDVPVPP